MSGEIVIMARSALSVEPIGEKGHWVTAVGADIDLVDERPLYRSDPPKASFADKIAKFVRSASRQSAVKSS